ncbi:hypothetical protein [Sphingopyxis sp. LK2115]|jgi:hypothetical protein|uniref:hypothetical protein n=1 Tax=Sphingopyxis sp. LK2115 TaxID=2744558 RepID=UPI0016604219|nr:hypothetical protein [Sphingopyxis sp. LK2115]
MTKTIALFRPATSAIAAFLVLSTPAAFAQEAPISMTSPVAAPAPHTTPRAPETGPAMVPPPAVQPPAAQSTPPAASPPVIRVPLDIAPAAPAPAKAEAAPSAKRSQAQARSAQTARQAPATPAAAPGATTSTAEPPRSVPIAGTANATSSTIAPSAATVTPAGSAAAPPASGDFPWEIVGAAAALIALGGASLVLARRRRIAVGAAQNPGPQALTMPAPRTPDQPWVTPDYAAAPMRLPPTFVAAPSGSMGRHEAMAMAGPTPDNPFLTLSKRLKRARFFDRQERLAYAETLGAQKDRMRKPVGAWGISPCDNPAAPQEQEVARPAPTRGHRALHPGFSRF